MKKEPDGFVCDGCSRVIYHMALAPLCARCREEVESWDRYDFNVPPTKRNGWWLFVKLSWDALIRGLPFKGRS